MNPVYARARSAGMLLAMSRRTFSNERWREIFEQQQASGLPVAAFCRRTRVPPASFYAWRRKLRETAAGESGQVVRFAEVKVAPQRAAEAGGIELRLPGGRCVVVRPGFDRQTLLELLATLALTDAGDGQAASAVAAGEPER